MTDDEWRALRQHVIRTAFQTGRPVFADSDGALHFADGLQEKVPLKRSSWWKRLKQRLRGVR